MLRRSILSVVLAVSTLCLGSAAALAGGWAVVTLDSVPDAPHAGQAFQIGFMVRQHGRTPINNVQPHVVMRSAATGESTTVEARQEGPTGHFVAELRFDSAGTWEWEIIPEPFAGTKLAPITVLAPASAPTNPPSTAISALAEPSAARRGLMLAGVLMLVVAAALALRPLPSPASQRVDERS